MSCWIAGSALGCAVWAQPVPPAPFAAPVSPTVVLPAAASDASPGNATALGRPTLAEALASAWPRSLAAAESQGWRRQADAERLVAHSWLAAPPAIDVLQREGRGAAARDVRETEIGLALPLWRFGQRRQQAQSAQAESDWVTAAERAARLRLAGELRDLAVRLALVGADLEQAASQRQLLDELFVDIARRVRAGDLAPVDEMAAHAEALSARSAEREARQTDSALRSAWQLSTGLSNSPLPEGAVSEPADADTVLAEHPELRFAEAAVRRARERVAQVKAQRGGAPELGIGLRQDRAGGGQPREHTVALSLRLPFGTETHSAPRLAAALAEEDAALMAEQRLRRQLAADLALARGQLDVNQAAVAAETERATLLRERARHLKRAFDAGETPLPELLRAIAAAGQAAAAANRQQALLAQAQGRLQQALGQLP
ncbi:TolC family protein [Roseateles chitinivorans]|uniref:TolC family protein n=1 Tax=Roseateles chitinivorans TaxID=2917965 RepID=UPI00260A178F|nr:TolC family protein [uncultured Roseateles sp.]